ncbi:MAG: response regulator [Candidatus Hydrogenedentes bacterium]|nr:response regulator [Candidatus Hydrogenedentota bacterium]
MYETGWIRRLLRLCRVENDSAAHDLAYWRSRIFSAILFASAVFGLFAYIPSVYLSLATGAPDVAFIDTVVYIGVLYIWRAAHIAFAARATAFLALIYVLGTWLLISIGPISMIYLFGFSMLAGMLLSFRAGLIALALNAVTLLLAGYYFQASFSSPLFPEAGSFSSWIVITLNFLLVNTVMSASLGALIRGLELSLAQQRSAAAELRRVWMAVDQASDMIILADAQGRPAFVNRACERMTGLSPQAALANGCALLRMEAGGEVHTDGLRHVLAQGSETDQSITLIRTDGHSRVPAQAAVSPLFDEEGRPAGHVVVVRDLSRVTMLEERLRQVQKMEAIGTLAGGIAHDFNNILMSILGHAELLETRLEFDGQGMSHVEEIRSASMRARDLVRQILLFSRQIGAKPEPVDVAAILREALRLLRPSIPSTIEIVADTGGEPRVVMGTATELHQIFMNLCTNAYHAMEDTGGTLYIAVSTLHVDAMMTAHHPQLRDGMDYVHISVEDTGAGMPPETLARIFEPYFSTKDKSKGSGLGLATVHGIVTALGGVITAYSEVNQGTSMSIYLPQVAAEVKKPGPALPVADVIPPGGGRRVLVVDDEAMLGNLMRQVLAGAGYDVAVCNGSEEALALFSTAPYEWNLVITDLTMPKMTGVELCKRLRGIRADLPLVLTSGFSEIMSQEELDQAGAGVFLYKPFTRSALGNAMARVLPGTDPVPAAGAPAYKS